MNFDHLGKLTGWLPGAGIGAVAGALLLWLGWESIASPERCGFVIAGVACTTLFGSPMQFPGAIVAATAVGGIGGAIINGLITLVRPDPT